MLKNKIQSALIFSQELLILKIFHLNGKNYLIV